MPVTQIEDRPLFVVIITDLELEEAEIIPGK
jgi:hypothetical protein